MLLALTGLGAAGATVKGLVCSLTGKHIEQCCCEEMRAKVQKIEAEMFDRLQNLSSHRDQHERQEREALSAALSILGAFKRDKLSDA